MSSASAAPSAGGSHPAATKVDRSELGVAAFLLAVGVLVLYNTSQLSTNIATTGPVGPKVVPTVVGVLLLVLAGLLALDVLRGGQGEPEGGEDVDLTGRADWKTVGLLSVAFLANAALIDTLGWEFSGALMFFLAAYALGSRRILWTAVTALAMSFGTWYLFVLALGINLPAGVLEGIL